MEQQLLSGDLLLITARISIPCKTKKKRVFSKRENTPLAGAVGLEPTTNGFGDRDSTN